jgi:hypothetical protein
MTEPLHEPVIRLVGEELATVTFVRDYVQLGFDGPLLTSLTPLVVTDTSGRVTSGDDQFRNRLCDLIGKQVTGVDLRAEDALFIRFGDGSSVSLSLRADDYPGPEAVNFRGADGQLIVL